MGVVLGDIAVRTGLSEVIKRLAVTEQEDVDIVRGLYEQAKRVARPKVVYREVPVQETEGNRVRVGGVDFNSPALAMALKDTQTAFAYVATCGTEVDAWSRKESDYVLSLWLDMIKEMFLRDANAFFAEHLRKQYGIEKVASASPGAGNAENWPITQQKPLFSLIGDVQAQIGVRLMDSFLMVPIKSSSGLMFPSETGYSSCRLCNREHCIGRREPYDGRMHDRAFPGG